LLQYEKAFNTQLRILLLHKSSLRILQQEKNYWNKFKQKFMSFLYKEKKYADNTVNNVFKIIKIFFNYLQIEKAYSIGNYHKQFRVSLQNTTPTVLQIEQLHFLISDNKFEENLNNHLKRVKDIFVFGCTVALRVSDLMKLQQKNITTHGEETYLSLFTQKTNALIQIPLPHYAVDIIKKYKSKNGKYLLPRLSNTNLNIQIKKLIQKAGWDYSAVKVISKQGKLVELKNKNGNVWKFYEHITAHTMRRTAITTLLILGVPEIVVRNVSGHAPGSKEFYKYVSIAQSYLNKEVKNAHQKLMLYTLEKENKC
jgi:integrase